jgi:adenylylsulfate kinase
VQGGAGGLAGDLLERALVLTGGLGTGKSAVAKEVVAAAAERGLRVAAIDLDWLGWASGAALPVDQLIGRNLAGVARNYRAAGVDHLVLARALVAPESLEAFGDGLAGWELVVLRLTVPAEVAEHRLRVRDSGAELADHLAEMDDMARRVVSAAPGAAVVANAGPLRPVALRVMRAAGWIDD